MTEHAAVQTVQPPAPQLQPVNKFHLQRKCACGSYSAGGKCDKCQKHATRLHREAVNDATPSGVPSIVNDVLASSSQPLQSETRAWMEPRFGYDFSNVRVHTDTRAAQSAEAVNALAYTVGQDVVFGAGQYAPDTARGSRLLVHELTHVVQQARAGTNTQQTAKAISEPSDAAELEADKAVDEMLSGAAVSVKESPSATIHALSGVETGLLIGGSIAGAVGIGLGIAYLAGAFDQDRAVSDLPADLIERLRPACEPSATPAQRQAAIDALVAWARGQSSLTIDWSKVASVRFDASVGAQGSQTNADDPNHISVLLGPVAFSSVSNLYSTFRHEMVHVQEHQSRPRAEILSRGQGVQEVYAYLWELEHQQQTGLARRENWGLSSTGAADVSVGLARVVDGLFRGLSAMSTELQTNPSMIPAAEQLEIERRVACAMTQTPSEVVRAVLPSAPLDRWQRECSEGVRAPQPKLSSHANLNELGISSPESPEEREADYVANRISQGWTANSIRESTEPTDVHRSASGLGAPGFIPRGGGMPFPVPVREHFEAGFGRSFDDVRIHTDEPAARSALSLQADAFTVGPDIYFGAGKFDPESTDGRRLIAHELTHTVQQQGTAQSVMRQAAPGPSPTPASPAAEAAPEPTGPAAYDGCPEPQSVIAARTEAAAKVARAVELLDPAKVTSVAPLLQKHFHVDASRPESQETVALIRSQFSRMETGLTSEIRIFCRSVPRATRDYKRSTMPPDNHCGESDAFSTSCANNAPSATVMICEGRINEGGNALVKTIIHEFAHVACNGNPNIPTGGEVYYNSGEGLPGTSSDMLMYADSYAWFAMEASPGQLTGGKKDEGGLSGLEIFGIVAGSLGAAGLIGVGIAAGAGAFKK